MSVFVLDRHHEPLMPCSEKRARLLLERKRAVVHRFEPFCIRLKDRQVQESILQPVVLKIDPGSQTSGIALARVQSSEPGGEAHHALHLAHLHHRGDEVKAHLDKRRGYRRRRRSANLRFRASRFLNRRRPSGWLPPSLLSRIGNVLTWASRYREWLPLIRVEVELVKFDTQLMQNAEISGLTYQQGELAGREVRCYLLEKFERCCVYCGTRCGPFEIDHLLPRSRGGSERISNLVLACHNCNQAKGNQTASEFGHGEVERQAKKPLRDAAVVNTTRSALVKRLLLLGLPVGVWSGGRTRWNRERFALRKDHSLDAICVGDVASVHLAKMRIVNITALGRGWYGRTLVDGSGFPRGYLMQHKRVQGFQTGDLVRAQVPETWRNKPLKTHGLHRGRVVVRKSGAFRVAGVDGINVKYCHMLQRADGYEMGLLPKQELLSSHPGRNAAFHPLALCQKYPEVEV